MAIVRPTPFMVNEAGHALRALARSPGFSLTVVLTLALGVGANAAMFDIVDRLLFRPHAYLRDPAAVHRLYWQWQDRGAITTVSASPYTRYLDIQRESRAFAATAAFYESMQAVGEGPAARERRVAAVSASYFDFFDAPPALGRYFTTDEDRPPRGADVAVLSHGTWQSDYGGRNVIGERLQVGTVSAAIVGVAPADFNGVDDTDPPALFVPITTYAGSTGTDDAKTYFRTYRWGWMNVMARRKPGITVAQAEADASAVFERSWIRAREDQPASPAAQEARPRVRVSALRPGGGPNPALEAQTARWLALMSLAVLVIACANIANLFLARALGRRTETAVRLALGVSRTRLSVQPMLEALMLAAAGAALALLFAQAATPVLRALLLTAPSALPALAADVRTVGVTLLLATLAAVGGALAPLGFARRHDLAGTLRRGGRGRSREGGRLRAALVLVQATLSVALLVGAALFVNSLNAVRALPMGYDAARVLLVNRVIRGTPFTADAQIAMRRTLLDAARSLPEVESAAWVSSAPFVSTSWTALYLPDRGSAESLGVFTYQATTADYFRTMGTRILAGRALADSDAAGAPDVAVVSESMARVLWPGRDPLGECFRMREAAAPCRTVVGVAEDIVQQDLAATRSHYYVPIDQYPRTWGNGLVLRLRNDPARDGEAVRAALQRHLPGASYLTARPLAGIVARAQKPWRLGATVFVAFGLLALGVAALGLSAVAGYDVAERRQELGIRVALGASRQGLTSLVLGRSLRVVVAAVALGVAIAAATSRWLEPLLYRQPARDPFVYGAVSVIVMAVALLATAVPAYRAATLDPLNALKSD
jgi:predicted permease